ncbi:MAG: AraC family transcriptional regulator [Eubacteriales bacterium]
MLEVKDLISEETKALTGEAGLENEITNGYACDLLSWVMSHGQAGTAWVTVQRNLNVVAVATLIDCTCIVLAEGVLTETDFLDKAKDEGIAVLSTTLNAYQFSVQLAAMLENK